jgi:hypothetical protein
VQAVERNCQHKIDNLNEEIAGEIEELKNSIGQRADSVAFTVIHAAQKAYSAGQKIEFPTILTNEGGGYVVSQNDFMCPQSGMYMFYVSVVKNNDYDDAIVDIVKNGTPLVTAFGASTYNSAASNSVIVRCNSGERVDIRCTSVKSCNLRSTTGGYANTTTFSGFLISSD